MFFRTVPRCAVAVGIAALLALALVDSYACASTGRRDGGSAPASSGTRFRLAGHLGWSDVAGRSLGFFETLDEIDDDDERKSLKIPRVPLAVSLGDRVGLASPGGDRRTRSTLLAGPLHCRLRC